MSLFDEYRKLETRRQFFGHGKNVLGAAALTSLLGDSRIWAGESLVNGLGLPHFPPKVKKAAVNSIGITEPSLARCRVSKVR